MKIYIDFSVFTESGGAFGNVTGEIEFAALPQAGDIVALPLAKAGVALDPQSGFMGLIEVHRRLLIANPGDGRGIQLSLSDVTVPTPDAARILADYLERAFGLFIDVYNES